MKKWDKLPDASSSGFDPWSPEVSVNQISLPKPVDCFHPNQWKDGQMKCEPRYWHQDTRGFDFPHGAPTPADTRGGPSCSCWDCGRERSGAAAAAAAAAVPAHRGVTRETERDGQSDEEELEPPLPLLSDEEWQQHHSLPPHHYRHGYGLHPTLEAHYYQYDLRYPPHPPHPEPAPCTHAPAWDERHTWPQQGASDTQAPAGVSVNMPQFSLPPADGVSQVGMMMRRMTKSRAEAPVSHPQERRRTISLPDSCRNIFITYSSDVCSEMVPFVDFLTKHSFHPAIDLFDDPVRSLDINKWKDTYLKDPSYLIIIAISPKYKADIEGSLVDSHGLHTKYIHSMMQNEFIQQGSLNFRFIPVLFLSASQKHVPSWLQNTRVYRWPHDTEDLLLRLLRVEKYLPPPVPVELTLIIRPVAPSAAATM